MTEVDIEAHRRLSTNLLKSSGDFRAVRTPRGQKDPGHLGWDPRSNTAVATSQLLHIVERNDDNLGIHLYGRYVDVDVDSDNPYLILALDALLPPCSHVWGHASRPRTHRLYEVSEEKGFNPSMFSWLERVKAYPPVSVEMRGGKLENGRYTLLPGSIHPSGKPYLWDNIFAANSSPTVVSTSNLTTAIRLACAASLVALAWQEGSRNDASLAFSGFLFRVCALLDDFGDKAPFSLDREGARSLFETVIEITDDDEPHMRLSTFDKTWDKAEKGGAVKGGRTLAKLIDPEEPDKPLSMLYALLVGSNEMEQMEEFFQRYALINNSKSVVDLSRPGKERFVIPTDAFRESNQANKLLLPDGAIEMTRILQASKRAIRVDGIRVVPNAKGTEREKVVTVDGELYANSWAGWAVDPHPDSVTDDEVRPFLSYVFTVLANGDGRVSDWILQWCADIFQHPERKPGSSLFLVGEEGAGKSFLGASILSKIIGPAHSAVANRLETLTGNFNADTAGKLFIQCDEVLNSRRAMAAEILKDNIDGAIKRVEPKGQDAYYINSIERYLFTSNHKREAIPISPTDRRYVISEVSNLYADKKGGAEAVKYWKFMGQWFGDAGNLAKVHRYLCDLPLGDTRLRVIDTSTKQEMAQRSQTGFDAWLMRIVNQATPFDDIFAPDRAREPDGFKKDSVEHTEPTTGKTYELRQYVEDKHDWPSHVVLQRLQKAWDVYRQGPGRSFNTPELNGQQLKKEFSDRGLMPKSRVFLETNVEIGEYKNDEYVVTKRRVKLVPFPSQEDIGRYLFETFGLEPDVLEEDDTLPPSAPIRKAQPDY